MNRLILVVLAFLLNLNFAHAQTSLKGINTGKYLGPNFNPYAGIDKNLRASFDLKNLPTIGFDGHGFYPFCSDVVRVYEKYNGKVDWDSIRKKQSADQTSSPENIELEVIHFADRVREANNMHLALGCFGGETNITVLMRNKKTELTSLEGQTRANATIRNGIFKVPTIYQYDLTKVPFIMAETPISEFEKLFMDAHVPYILSSTIEIIPNSTYHVDCWSEVYEIKKGHVQDEDYLNHIEVKAPVTRLLHVTPAHRFYMCSQSTGQCSWQRAENLKLGMSFYGNSAQRYPFTAMTHFLVGDNEEFGVDRFGQVYNLSTETYTYYVGPNGGRVLVHNIK